MPTRRRVDTGLRRAVYLQFKLDDDEPVTTSELLSIVFLADDYSRYLALREADALLQDLPIEEEERVLTVLQLRSIVAPEILDLERGSVIVEIVVSSATILTALTLLSKYVLKDAWDGSRAKEVVVNFIRDKIFGGAKKELEQKRLATPQINNISVTQIAVTKNIDISTNDLAEFGEGPSFEVTLERKLIMTPQKSDQELLEDFAKKVERARKRKTRAG